MPIINFRHGRLYVEDGSATPTPGALSKVITFSGGTFTFTEPRERNLVRDRGEIQEVTVGDDQPIDWSFTAQYEDRTSMRTIRDGVWDNTAETITGLTANALNLGVPTAYDYEQNSLQIAAGDAIAPGTKLAIGVAPAVAGEFSENAGAANVETVVAVPAATGWNIFMPVGDTDVDIVYDAVGRSTLNPALLAAGACTGSISFFRLRLDIYDPCNPPSVKNLSQGIVTERITLEVCWLTEDSFSENEEADEVAFSGQSLDNRASFVAVP